MKSFNERKAEKVKQEMAKKKTTSVVREKGDANNAISIIEKKFGKGTISKLGDESVNSNIERIPFGIMELDIALGGGAPKGRIIELYGGESGGKSSLLLQLTKQVQEQGGKVAYLDVEHAMSIDQAKNIGVDIDELFFVQPDYMEQAFDITKELAETGDIDLIIIDSTNALVPKAELEGEFGQAQMGLAAREMSQALKMLTGVVSKTNTILAFVSQVRAGIGPFAGKAIGVGNSLKFYASIRMEISRIETLKKGEDPYAIRSRVKVVKNKTAAPFKSAEIVLNFETGYDVESSLLAIATKYKIAEKSGSWYSFNGNRIGQGEANVCDFLRENPEVYNEMHEMVLTFLVNKEQAKLEKDSLPPSIDPETGEILTDSNEIIEDSDNSIEVEFSEEQSEGTGEEDPN